MHGEQPDLAIVDCRPTLARLVVVGGVTLLRDESVGSDKPVARRDLLRFVVPYFEDGYFYLWTCDEVGKIRVIAEANVEAGTDL